MVAVDEFDIVGDAPAESGEAAGSPVRRRWSTRSATWVATAAALVLVGVMTASPTPLIVGRGDGPDIGLLELPLTRPPVLLWQTELPYSTLLQASGDRAVVTTDDDGLTRTLLGIDLGTGAEAWRYEDHDYSCQSNEELVCVESPGTEDATIVVLALEDGARTKIPHPQALAALVSGDDLVVVEKTDRDNLYEDVVLVQTDATERWRIEIDAADADMKPLWAPITILGDTLAVGFTGDSVDLATGEVSSQQRLDYGDGVWADAEDPSSLHTAEGVIEIDAHEHVLYHDDDLGGPVLLKQPGSGVLVASLRGTDTELWKLAEPSCYPWLRLRGSIVLACWDYDSGRIMVLDEATGKTRWERPDDGWPLAASADALIVSSGSGSAVVAVNPVTGAELWSVPAADADYTSYLEISDGLLVSTGEELLRLRW